MQNLMSCAGCDMGAFDMPGGDIPEATEIPVQVANWPIKIKKNYFSGVGPLHGIVHCWCEQRLCRLDLPPCNKAVLAQECFG